MNKREYKEFLKRYDKFKNNNLPTPFFDKERDTFEYVYFDNDKLNVYTSIFESLSRVALTGLYYPFNSKMVTHQIGEEPRVEYGHNHAHSFEEVVMWLYYYPESFNLDDECLEYYSKQELDYLKRVQKYLLFIGMKDTEGVKANKTRYRNKKQKKYNNCTIHRYSKETIEELVSGKRNFTYIKAYSESWINEKFEDFQALIVDEEDNFKLHVRYTHQERKKYSEIKNIVKDDKYEDDDILIIRYLEILEKF